MFLKFVYSRSARFRDGQTTIKTKLRFSGGVGHSGQTGKSSKTLFFVGNVTTIKLKNCKFYCRDILLSLRRLLEIFKEPLWRGFVFCLICSDVALKFA